MKVLWLSALALTLLDVNVQNASWAGAAVSTARDLARLYGSLDSALCA